MARQKPFQVPKVTSPPTAYEVVWVDAAHESEHDGPALEAGGLAVLPYLGYHVATKMDEGRRIVVLASEHDLDANGHLTCRFTMTIQARDIRSMTPLYPRRQADGEQEGTGS